MGKKLFLFTLDGCSHCSEVKDRLISEQIDFYDIEINKYEFIWKKIIEETNQDYVPTIYISDDDQGSIYVPETDFNNIDELFDIIYKNIKGI